MLRPVFAIVASLYASSLFAGEEIYLYIKYTNDENARVSHKMQCQDSRCTVASNAAEQPLTLTGTQKDQILNALQSEVSRLDITSKTEAGSRPVKIKFKYRSESKRVDITQHLPADQLTVLSAELTTVLETYFAGLDLSSLGPAEPATSHEEPAAPADQEQVGSDGG